MTIINQIAAQERAISGVRNSYGFAQNPDLLNSAALPAVLHYIPVFDSAHTGHFNTWTNTITVKSLLFVTPREAQGGKLKFIENEVIPFGQKWRQTFQTESVLRTLMTNTASVRFFLVKGEYGAGPPELEFGGISYLGWVFTWDFSQKSGN